MSHILRQEGREPIAASIAGQLVTAKCIYPSTVSALLKADKDTPIVEERFDRGLVWCRTILRFDLGTACRHRSDS